MDTRDVLAKYLDIGVEDDEMETIAMIALQNRLKQLKMGIAESIIQSQAAAQTDNLEGSNAALKQARKLKKEYHHFYAEWRRLNGDEEEGHE